MAFDHLGLAAAGFAGFQTVSVLRNDRALIPAVRGVYAVLRLTPGDPDFLRTGSGVHFKGKDPNVSIEVLSENWVAGAEVVYIGKAGDPGRAATLQSRLWQYLRFGAGMNVGHWGTGAAGSSGNLLTTKSCWSRGRSYLKRCRATSRRN